MFEITCLDKYEEAFFFFIYRDIHFGLWSALFLRLLGLLTLLVNMFRAANLHRRVLVRVKGWYVERRGAQSWFQQCVDWFGLWMRRVRVRTQNEGSSVSACMCQEMHPALTHAHWYEAVHGGEACEEQTSSSLCWHTTWPCNHSNMHPTSQLFLSLFSLSLCFLLLYGAAPSSSDPQEAIHFLIICTSNRGRHRDADHKFSPPPLRCGAIALQQLPLIGAVGSNC